MSLFTPQSCISVLLSTCACLAVPLDNQPERKGRFTTPASQQANKPSTVYTPLPQPRPQATSTMDTHPTCEPGI